MKEEIKITFVPPGWFLCREGLHIWPTKEQADNCCKGRHSRESKEVYRPSSQSKKPGVWVS